MSSAIRSTAADTLTGGSVQVFGENMWYQAAGVAEENPTVLFLHESGGDSATWNGQLAGLSREARCLAVDLPGHGRSEGMGFASVTEYRQAVLEFLDALAIRWPVVLAGVCLGAAIAVDMARHAPTRVAGLVLAGVVDGGRATERIRSRTALGEAQEGFVDDLFGPRVAPRMRDERLRRWQLTSPLARHADLMALSTYPLARTMRQVSHAMVLVAGEEDRVVAPRQVYELAAGLPQARVVTVPEAGCLAMVEQPAAFNRAAASFLATLQGARPMGTVQRLPGGYRRRLPR
ncbi:MAG TPA: alpha/beta fold hydrolase [Symbiobacteriaceae bacterium]|jgi:pimeloyl-ACP methyl ester carboxylesterase|nr:alpha/beta fold hydrolase [Symbiobacteriaceae bacterium]